MGTATGKGLLDKGLDVVFFDPDPTRLTSLRSEGLHAFHPDELAAGGADAYLISVPTPTVEGRANTSYVERAAAAVGSALGDRPGRPLVVVRSTVPPGTTDGLVKSVLERASGRQAGVGFGLCVNPEFLRAATALDDFMNPRVILIGALDAASELALRRVYAGWQRTPIVATTLRTAEAAKYVANVFNAAKISFFNEMLRILTAIDVDAATAFDAAVQGGPGFADPWYGTVCGAPYGGHCLPKDTEAFLGFAEDLGFGNLMHVLRAAMEVNDEMAAGSAVPDALTAAGVAAAG